jgi:predicted amidohydrolase
VDPWGSVIAQCSDIHPKDGEGDFCLAEINLDKLASVRQGMHFTFLVNYRHAIMGTATQ